MKTITIEGVEYELTPIDTNTTIQKRKDLEWGELAEDLMDWDEAMEWAQNKGNGWRLPTSGDLYDAYEKKITGFGTGIHWSSTEYSETLARNVNFSYGSVNNNFKSNSNSVRLVRYIN